MEKLKLQYPFHIGDLEFMKMKKDFYMVEKFQYNGVDYLGKETISRVKAATTLTLLVNDEDPGKSDLLVSCDHPDHLPVACYIVGWVVKDILQTKLGIVS